MLWRVLAFPSFFGVLFSIGLSHAEAPGFRYELKAYYSASCAGEVDAQRPGSPYKALRLGIQNLSLVKKADSAEDSLAYTFFHAILQCRMQSPLHPVTGDLETSKRPVARWAVETPPPGAGLLVTNWGRGIDFENVHFYQDVQNEDGSFRDAIFNYGYLANAEIPLRQILRAKEAAKYQRGETARGELFVKVGYNLHYAKNGRLLPVADSQFGFKTGSFKIRFQINADKTIRLVR